MMLDGVPSVHQVQDIGGEAERVADYREDHLHCGLDRQPVPRVEEQHEQLADGPAGAAEVERLRDGLD